MGLLGLLVAGATLTALVGSSAAAAPGLPAGCRPAPGVIRCTFVYTGRAQTWTVPAGVTEATFDVYGGQGADIAGFTQGGLGGHATADLASLTPGAPMTVVVGRQGQGGLGGFNGGGNGGSGFFSGGGGGGGASDVRIGGTSLADRVIVAGGGGGAANLSGAGPANGGGGGGSTGGNGASALAGTVGGAGGNQDGSTGSGQLGIGSDGGSSPDLVGSGGGGGGLYGGAGGPIIVRTFVRTLHYGTGGGGGSGFGPPGVAFETGVRSGNGLVTITYPARPECDSLQAFVSHVKAQIGITLTVAEAQLLIDSANQIAAQLGC